MSQKIDFVLAWVDGNDPAWLEERRKYAPYNPGDNREIRFRNWDNLHFWFRAVEKYAPWVNMVHLVTWGHLPPWLNIEHPRLNIVRHEDYLPEEYRPTFSSHTIELNLHRIKNLADRFVYFNDDTFITRETRPEDFFKQGLPRDSAVIMPVIGTFRNSTACIEANNMEIINTVFNKNKVLSKNILKWFNPLYRKHLFSTLCCMPYRRFAGFYVPHLPNAYLKETFEQLWEREEDVLYRTSLQKFREARGVNQSLVRYWQLVNGNFIPRSTGAGRCFSLTNYNDHAAEAIRGKKYQLICINDNDLEPIIDFEREKELLKSAFAINLPDRSSFELERG